MSDVTDQQPAPLSEKRLPELAAELEAHDDGDHAAVMNIPLARALVAEVRTLRRRVLELEGEESCVECGQHHFGLRHGQWLHALDLIESEELTAAQDALARLRGLLGEWGRHRLNCAMTPTSLCTCGWLAVERELAGERPAGEAVAPSFGYATRRETAVAWEQVPQQNKALSPTPVPGFRQLHEAGKIVVAADDRHFEAANRLEAELAAAREENERLRKLVDDSQAWAARKFAYDHQAMGQELQPPASIALTYLDAQERAEAELAAARERERGLRTALGEHWLANVECDHERKLDKPWCACSLVDLGWHPSVGAAVEAWIAHLFEVALAGEGGDGD